MMTGTYARRACCATAWIAVSIAIFGSTDAAPTAPAGKLAKAYPGSSDWPAVEQWQALNASLAGKLIQFSNPGQICYGASFDKESCERFKINVNNATFVGDNAGLTNWPQWAGNSCPAPLEKNVTSAGPADGCAAGKYPSYVVKAMSAEDVSTAVKWAAKAGVRVVVKNTGHDFLGRNVGMGSLSIWTRNIQSVKWHEKWNGTPAPNDVSGKWDGSAFTYGSGMIWGRINAEANLRKHIVVSGAENSVGAGGGWLLGGGHGPYSNQYGLGVEQVLEFEVVTPDGEIRIANQQSNKDLFWALRGGGASTYGIVTRISYKAYPAPEVTFIALYMAPKDKSNESQEKWYNAMGFYMAMQTNFTNFGASGYPMLSKDSYSALLQIPGKNVSQVETWFEPIAAKLKAYDIIVEPNMISNDLYTTLGDLAVGTNGPAEPSGLMFSMSSRLFSRETLREENVPALAKMVKAALSPPGAYLLPYNNMPGASHANRTWDYGLNPAWKDASLHLMSNWHLEGDEPMGRIGEFKKRSPKTQMEKVKEMQKITKDTIIPALDALSLNHGAYINEASPFEVDWKTTFYGGGSNYEKLLAVKQKYDPQNLLWCFPCVGGDIFKEGEDGKLYYQ